MQQMIADKNQLKEVFKQAFTELLQEQRDLLYDVFAEVLEDIAMVMLSKKGKQQRSSPERKSLKSWRVNLES